MQYCPGEVCEIKDRHEIQKMSSVHGLIVLGFVGYIVLVVFIFHDFFKVPPYDLFGLTETEQVEVVKEANWF